MLKACAKPLLSDANYDHENNDSTNVLRPRHFKWCDFLPQILYVAPYARAPLPANFSPKHYFNKLCFQLPQNVTWTHE